MAELLQVRDLKKYFKTPGGLLHAVDNVNFTIGEGKTLGVVGESGCGKSTLGRTVLGLIDPTDGEVIFKGEDVTFAKGRRRRELRRKKNADNFPGPVFIAGPAQIRVFADRGPAHHIS